VLSYLLLKGRCSNCNTRISLEYPLVEATTAVLSVAVAWKFGVSWQTVLGLLLTWSLIALTVIDFHKQLLPDSITLPLLWLGILANIFEIFTPLESSVIGAMAGYLALWSVYHFFKLLTGKEGMGYGDFKLLAVLGAWLGWTVLPIIILLSSLVGAVIGIMMIVVTRHDKNIPIPFGPYLAIAGWVALIWGDVMLHAWLG
jgi:leader peptidase (prepilin peptidase) / N-methyltransferase